MRRAIPYSVSVGPDVTEVTPQEFAGEVTRVLSDPRGWLKYGYFFYPVNPTSDGSARSKVLHIHLERAEKAAADCGIAGFSCWRGDQNDIIINLTNWLGGSQSRLPLERYHNYVICHEVGHALGLDHQKCPAAECARRGLRACPASVMQQMTRGPEAVCPCVESDWPLDPDWLIDDPEPDFGKKRASAFCRYGIIIAVVLLILAVLTALVGREKQRSHGAGQDRYGASPSSYQ